MPAPSVLFIDFGTWEAFNALAGALRKQRIGVRRISVPGHDASHRAYRILERLLYGPTQILPAELDEARTMHLLTSSGIAAVSDSSPPIDVQAPDGVAHAMLLADPEAKRAMRRSRADFDQRHLYEKAYMTDLAASLGVVVAQPLSAPVNTFPVVVKASVGSGGQQVRVVHTQSEFDKAVAELTTGAGDPPMIQEYHGGGLLQVGAIAVDGELLVAVAYTSRTPLDDPQGPAVAVTAVDRPDVLEATKTLAKAVGSWGFLCLDFVLDSSGNAYFIDFNPRAFGSWPALQALGADFVGSYLYLLGRGPRPERQSPRYGRTQRLLKFPADDRSWATLRTWSKESALVVARSGRTLGWRWSAISAARIIVGAGSASVSVVKRRLSAGRVVSAAPVSR